MKTVPLSGKKAAGRVALVDDGDWDLVVAYQWHAVERTGASGAPIGPYASTKIPGGNGSRRGIFMHNLITGWTRVDHINHDGLDNQRSNLRPVTREQNQWNRLPNRGQTSPYKGVHWEKGVGKWCARIRSHGHQRYLGVFVSEVEAALTYDAAARIEHGEYAYLNFPEGRV